nr:MAG TPA_asm: hypothetical protein [Caudoviricetes sp.]
MVVVEKGSTKDSHRRSYFSPYVLFWLYGCLLY